MFNFYVCIHQLYTVRLKVRERAPIYSGHFNGAEYVSGP